MTESPPPARAASLRKRSGKRAAHADTKRPRLALTTISVGRHSGIRPNSDPVKASCGAEGAGADGSQARQARASASQINAEDSVVVQGTTQAMVSFEPSSVVAINSASVQSGESPKRAAICLNPR